MNITPIPYGRQWIDARDVAQVVKTLGTDFLTQGIIIDRFEQAVATYCGARYAVSFSSGTGALHGACFAAGIGRGDEVITTPMTFAASANCALYVGATATFADIKGDIPLIDPKEIEKKITKKTRIIISVDYSGIPADYDEIRVLARKHNLLVIADAAHSLGATYKGRKVGTLADMTVFSFHPVKVITTGEGGMVVTNNKKFYDRLKIFRTHGITKDNDQFHNNNEGRWYYEMQELGYNYRLTDIQASLGLSQLAKIDRFLSRRREIAKTYTDALRSIHEIKTLQVPADRESAWHLYPILLNNDNLVRNKKKIVDKFYEEGIGVQVHYIPTHLHPYYRKKFGYKRGDFPNTEQFYRRELSLPLFPKLTNEEIDYVIHTTRSILSDFIKP